MHNSFYSYKKPIQILIIPAQYL